MEASMFHFSQGSPQVYSPFGSYVVEQHDAGRMQYYIDDLPRPDLKFGKDHSLFEGGKDDHRVS
jgi:hypothetical protein